MAIRLKNEEKGILSYLGESYKDSINLKDITKYLKAQEYDVDSIKDVREDLNHLIRVGYVRSKTEGKGDKREEKFYLSRTPLGGKYKQKQVQGRELIHETSKLWQRIFNPKLFGSLFLLFGFGFVAYDSLNVTGAVISSAETFNPAFFLICLLLAVGIVLLTKSIKESKK